MRRTGIATGWFLLAMLAAMLSAAEAEPASPETAARAALQALAGHQPEGLYDLLPASYRSDLESLAATFAARMDAELWNRMRALIQSSARIAISQQELLADFAVRQGAAGDPADIRAAIDATARLASTLAAGEGLQLEQLQSMGLRPLLAREGRLWMQSAARLAQLQGTEGQDYHRLWSRAGQARVAVLAQDEQYARIRITDGERSGVVRVQRVEDQWIPADLARQWPGYMQQARLYVEAVDYSSPAAKQQKTQSLMILSIIEGMLAPIRHAESVEDLEGSLLGLLAMSSRMLNLPAGPAP